MIVSRAGALMSLFLAWSHGFVPLKLSPRHWHVAFSSSSDDERINEMRKLLEASWNTENMGLVPSSPETAAKAAATSLQHASENGKSLFFVDILLPSYDISQGEQTYDDVLAVEFCVALAAAMEDQTLILLRDEKALKTVKKIFDARERYQIDSVENEEDDRDELNIVDDDISSRGDIGSAHTDAATFQKEEPHAKAANDLDSFREQLMESWDSASGESLSEEPETTLEPAQQQLRKLSPNTTNESKLYRLASLLGDAQISQGSDMLDDVVKAVKANGMPKENEETIILLSAVTKEELIAIRSLVGTFKTNKRIVLVNCKLDPLPRELMRAETAYSILPLIAKPVKSERNLFESNRNTVEESEASAPKVVIMRRYPQDWEVYVDVDSKGFELADRAPANQVGKKGPPLDWVATTVKRHLQSKLG